MGSLCLLFTDSAFAWGPATHLHYGLTILSLLSELPVYIRELLSGQTLNFLYGCVSADIVLAKKLGKALTHCHRWENGIRLIEETDHPKIKAFAFGYVCHLAADTISHNCYVPSKTIESYDSGILKHMYWELMFDKKVTTPEIIALFQEIAKTDFRECDEYMESKIQMRIFGFSTNKKIFNQLLILQGLNRWQKLWTGLSDKNPWTLHPGEVEQYTERSIHAIMSFLKEYKNSHYTKVDPTGEKRLKGAEILKKHYRKQLSLELAPSVKLVREAMERFAREPFLPIEIDELKAA